MNAPFSQAALGPRFPWESCAHPAPSPRNPLLSRDRGLIPPSKPRTLARRWRWTQEPPLLGECPSQISLRRRAGDVEESQTSSTQLSSSQELNSRTRATEGGPSKVPLCHLRPSLPRLCKLRTAPGHWQPFWAYGLMPPWHQPTVLGRLQRSISRCFLAYGGRWGVGSGEGCKTPNTPSARHRRSPVSWVAESPGGRGSNHSLVPSPMLRPPW